MDELLVLTDARGFTTCCALNDMFTEISRHPLHAPIRVYHWRKIGWIGDKAWRLEASYTYPETR